MYYNCNNVPDVVIDDQEEPCFNFSRKKWLNYLKKNYEDTKARF